MPSHVIGGGFLTNDGINYYRLLYLFYTVIGLKKLQNKVTIDLATTVSRKCDLISVLYSYTSHLWRWVAELVLSVSVQQMEPFIFKRKSITRLNSNQSRQQEGHLISLFCWECCPCRESEKHSHHIAPCRWTTGAAILITFLWRNEMHPDI